MGFSAKFDLIAKHLPSGQKATPTSHTGHHSCPSLPAPVRQWSNLFVMAYVVQHGDAFRSWLWVVIDCCFLANYVVIIVAIFLLMCIL